MNRVAGGHGGGGAGLFTFVGALAFYLLCAEPAPSWLDSPELAAGAASLGVAHPPGQPLALLVGKAASLVPLGSLALRVALASAVAGAVAASLVTLLALRLLEAITGEAPPPALRAIAVAGGLAFAGTWAHAFQCVRVEVYALHTALALGAGVLAVDAERSEGAARTRALLGGALCVGLGLCNHHLGTLVCTAPLVLWLVLLRPPVHALAGMLAVGALCAGLYAYLPLRAGTEPVNWGHPATLERFLWVVTAKAFQKTSERGEDSAAAFELIVQMTPLAAGLSLGGAWLLARSRRCHGLAILVIGLSVAAPLSTVVVGFDPTNADRQGWTAPGLGSLWALAVLPVALLARRYRRAALPLAAVAVALAVGQGARNLAALDRHDLWAADDVARLIWDSVPPRARVETANHQGLFQRWYGAVAEGARPDVQSWHRHFAGQPGYPPRPWTPDLVEVEFDTGAGEGRPSGAFMSAGGDPAAAETRTRQFLEAFDAICGGSADRETRRAALWRHFLLARLLCQPGQEVPALARYALARARAYNGGPSAELDALGRACGVY